MVVDGHPQGYRGRRPINCSEQDSNPSTRSVASQSLPALEDLLAVGDPQRLASIKHEGPAGRVVLRIRLEESDVPSGRSVRNARSVERAVFYSSSRKGIPSIACSSSLVKDTHRCAWFAAGIGIEPTDWDDDGKVDLLVARQHLPTEWAFLDARLS